MWINDNRRIDCCTLADMEDRVCTPQKEFFLEMERPFQPLRREINLIILWINIMPSKWLRLHRTPDAAQIAAFERPSTLTVLENTDDEHQDGSHFNQEPSTSNVVIEDVCSSEDLDDDSQQMALPELVVLKGIGSDIVGATKVQK